MKKISKILTENGLTEKEAQTYLALVEMRETSAYALSQRTGVKKATTYVVLEKLMQKGLVLKTPYSKSWRFRAKEPKEYVEEKEKSLRALSSVVPVLTNMLSGGVSDGITIYTFDGLENIKNGLWYGLDEAEDFVAFFASGHKASSELIELCLEWNDELAERGIESRVIAPEHESLKIFRDNDERHLRKTKILPFNSYPSETSVEVHTHFIRILNMSVPQVVIIENDNLATVLRNIFEMVWSSR